MISLALELAQRYFLSEIHWGTALNPPEQWKGFSSLDVFAVADSHDRAEYLGYTLGLRQGAYLALAPGGGANPAAATLLPRGSCDALFLLVYLYAPIPGQPGEEFPDRFFLGLAWGRQRAEAFFGSPASNSYPAVEELATAALLSYRRAFRWSQTLSAPLDSPEDVSPELLGELASEVREEFRNYHGKGSLAVDNFEGFLREGLALFALARPFLVALPPRRRSGKTYSLFNSAFALTYRYLESAPPDGDTPAGRKILEETLDLTLNGFVSRGNAGQLAKAKAVVNLATSLARRLFFVEGELGLWPRRSGNR